MSAASWLPFGPDGGDARRIVSDPTDPKHLYLGTTNGWIYESHDTGASWRRLARVEKRDDLVLDSIVVDAANPMHLIVGAWVIDHPDGGLFISYDAGKTWFNQAEMRGQSIRALRASPTDPKELVAGTLKGVFRSKDGGQRWAQISPPDSTEIHEIQSVAIDPADPNTIYAGTWHLPWKTTDGGEHWENIKEGIIEDSDVFSIIVDPETPKVVYASACSGIYKSEDAGHLFHKIQGIPSSARRTRVLMQDPNDLKIVFAGTTEGLWRSNDAGRTWERITGPEIIVNDVLIDKENSHHVLITTNRAGVLSSEDGGDTFEATNKGFSSRQITAMQRDRNAPGTVLVGVVNDKEWGGVFRSVDGGLNWSQRSEGLGGRDVFALTQAPDGGFIAGTAHGLFRMDQASGTWLKVEDAPLATHATDGLRPPAVQLEPVDSSAVAPPARPARHATAAKAPAKHMVSRNMTPARRKAALLPPRRVAANSAAPAARPVALAAGTPAGSGAEHAAGTGFNGPVYGLATAGETVLAITSAGLLASPDDGITWTAAGPPSSVDWRYLAAANENAIAASLHNLSYSVNAGKSWSATLLPEGLTQVGAVAIEPSGAMWVGGREGIFVSKDAGNTWFTPKNLFVSTVNSIYYDPAGDRMLVTSGGYGNLVFLVHLTDMKVTYADTGWNLRLARPMGDHLIAATLFDGVVVQPRMVESPMASFRTGSEPVRAANSSSNRQ